MNTISRIGVVLALAALAPGIVTTQTRKTHAVHEPRTIFSDRPLPHPVTMPPDVLRVLMETDAAKQVLDCTEESEQINAAKNAAQLFRATEVHLNRPDEVDLVVIGLPPMSGADHDWFWVVRSAFKDPKVVLYAGGSTLKLLGTRTHDYRDILTLLPLASATNCAIYRFDGNKYKIWKQKWTDNGGRPGAGCDSQ